MDRGNALYRLTHRDLDPLMDRVSDVLALTPDERALFVASRERRTEAAAATRSSRLLDYDRANVHALEMRARQTGRAAPATKTAGGSTSTSAAPSVANSEPGALGDILSTWMIAPLIFLFLLWIPEASSAASSAPFRIGSSSPRSPCSTMSTRRSGITRGIFLECCALGLTVMVFLIVVGVPLRWAIAIGIFTGASNVIPYMGFFAALLSGLAYALLAEEIHPLILLVSADTFAIWVVARWRSRSCSRTPSTSRSFSVARSNFIRSPS